MRMVYVVSVCCMWYAYAVCGKRVLYVVSVCCMWRAYSVCGKRMQYVVSVCCMLKVGQNRTYAPNMIIYLVISMPKIHPIYMVLANPMYAL